MEKGAYNSQSKTWIGYDSDKWVSASEGIIRYYMDPRNFLDSTNIFQFLNHGYSTGEQTEEGIEKMLKGTFMESKSSKKTVTQTSAAATKATEKSTTEATIKAVRLPLQSRLRRAKAVLTIQVQRHRMRAQVPGNM